MNFMKKRILSIALAASLAVSMAACGTPSASSAQTSESGTASASQSASGEEEIVIRVAWWGGQARHDGTIAAMDLYSELHPNVKFVTEFMDFSAYWDKMATQAAAGSLPDIMQMDIAYIRQYTENGLLADLSEYEASGVLNLDDAVPTIVESGRVDGKLTGVCLGINAPAMIYDKEAAEAAGVEIKNGMTMAEFEEAAAKIYEATGKTIDPGYQSGSTNPEYYVRGAGLELCKKGGLGVQSPDQLVSSFQLFEDAIAGGYCASPEELNSLIGATAEQSLLATGKTWMTFAWSNNLGSYSTAAGKEFGLVSYPTWENTEKSMYLKPGQYFSVTSNSKVVEECAKFLDFMTNSVEANQLLRAERGIPISTKVAEALKPELDEYTQASFDYVAEVEPLCGEYPVPETAGGTEMTNLFNGLYEQMVYNNLSAKEAAEEAFIKGNEILANQNG